MTLFSALHEIQSELPAALQPESAAFLVRLHEAAPSLPPLAERERMFIDSVFKVCLCSRFAADVWLRRPEILYDLLESRDLFSAERRLAYADAVRVEEMEGEAGLARALRELRRREMLRIAWRDLAGWADLDETLADLSQLAEVCIQAALDFHYRQACRRWGTPALADGRPFNLVVLGMGKLGAWELNFSSDIDLIFAYAEDGVLSGKKDISYEEFFSRITRGVVKALDEMTVDGFVFRVDLRLRPFGDSGPLLMSFDGMEKYYVTQAREWERYAMIKARQVAGDADSGRQLAALIKPFVYRRYLDYGAFDELRGLKMQIMQELKRKDRLDNVKLGPGGIREIEFIGQAFQLIRGGHDEGLRQRPIQKVLRRLAELELLNVEDADRLIANYRFLRRLENRLQAYRDQQTHDLPKDALARELLAYALNFADWASLAEYLRLVREQVQAVFGGVFSLSRLDSAQQQGQWLWVGDAADEQARGLLAEWGYADSAWLSELLKAFKSSLAVKHISAKGLQSLQRLLPPLLKELSAEPEPEQTCRRVLSLLEIIAGRGVYLALLAENPEAVRQLIRLSGASLWINRYIGLYPMLLDELLDPRRLYAPLLKEQLRAELERELAKLEDGDEEQLLHALRRFKHGQVLKVAAADVTGVIPIMVVSDYLTWIAEAVLEQCLHWAWRWLGAKHGYPPGCGETAAHFAIIGYGKLGGIELGYGSDLDLLFLHDYPDEQAETGGRQPIAASLFFQRLAQKMRHVLDAKLLSGELYPADLRLRPNGDSGVLTPNLDYYREYLLGPAWTWERQALTRARFICGDAGLGAAFARVRREVLTQARDYGQLQTEVREMRYKMRAAKLKPGYARFNVKHSPGGIADIEFLTQFLVLAHAARFPELCTHSDNVRLLGDLAARGLLQAEEAEVLRQAFCRYRDYGHHQVLQGLDATAEAGAFAEERKAVAGIWEGYLEDGG